MQTKAKAFLMSSFRSVTDLWLLRIRSRPIELTGSLRSPGFFDGLDGFVGTSVRLIAVKTGAKDAISLATLGLASGLQKSRDPPVQAARRS